MSVILPGSYDPITVGHLDIIRRAAQENEEVYAVIFTNPDKKYLFSLDDRVRMLILATDSIPNVLVSYSNGYVVDYMREHGIEKIVKGYRNDADLEYERVQAEYNMRFGGYETEFKKCSKEFSSVSSTEVRRRILEGESIDGLVTAEVAEYINGRIAEISASGEENL